MSTLSLKKNKQLKRNWKVMNTNANMFTNEASIVSGSRDINNHTIPRGSTDQCIEYNNLTNLVMPNDHRVHVKSTAIPPYNIDQSSRSSLDVKNYQNKMEQPRNRFRNDCKTITAKFPYKSIGQRASSIPSSKESVKSVNDDILMYDMNPDTNQSMNIDGVNRSRFNDYVEYDNGQNRVVFIQENNTRRNVHTEFGSEAKMRKSSCKLLSR